ncbi:15264_t:CDS:1, partial [Acaulospora colombiana]
SCTNLQTPALLDDIGATLFSLAITQPPTSTTQVPDGAKGEAGDDVMRVDERSDHWIR